MIWMYGGGMVPHAERSLDVPTEHHYTRQTTNGKPASGNTGRSDPAYSARPQGNFAHSHSNPKTYSGERDSAQRAGYSQKPQPTQHRSDASAHPPQGSPYGGKQGPQYAQGGSGAKSYAAQDAYGYRTQQGSSAGYQSSYAKSAGYQATKKKKPFTLKRSGNRLRKNSLLPMTEKRLRMSLL